MKIHNLGEAPHRAKSQKSPSEARYEESIVTRSSNDALAPPQLGSGTETMNWWLRLAGLDTNSKKAETDGVLRPK